MSLPFPAALAAVLSNSSTPATPPTVPSVVASPFIFKSPTSPLGATDFNAGGSWAHTASTRLFVAAQWLRTSASATSPGFTWNGVSMTAVGSTPVGQSVSGSLLIGLWTLNAAATGVQTLAFVPSGSAIGRIRGVAFDVADFGSIVWSDGLSDAATPATLSVDCPARTGTENNLLVGFGGIHRRNGSGDQLAVSTGWTQGPAFTDGSNDNDLAQSRFGMGWRTASGGSDQLTLSCAGNPSTQVAGFTVEIASS